MACYVSCNEAGEIEMWDEQPFPGSVQVDYEVVRGWDGKPYKAGKEPAPPLVDVQAAKRVEINAGFETAITGSLTMPSATNPPSAFAYYQAVEEWKANDPDGLAYVFAIHTAHRDALLAAVNAATTPDAVNAISVTYAV